MTQEDINEVVTKSMPQWEKDQFDAIHANADYIDRLRPAYDTAYSRGSTNPNKGR